MSKALKRILCLILILTAVPILLSLPAYLSPDLHFCFSEDPLSDPLNPSRGFYIQVPSDRPEKLEEIRASVKLCLLAYDLADFKDRELSEEKLQELEIFLQEAERQHIRCIFRAAYGFQRAPSNDADSFSRILQHVSQMTPVLNRHESQIYCVQAGFFGPWGEWHSSIYLDSENRISYERKLVSALLTQLDATIPVALRRPRFIRELGPEDERLCFHNDGLLASESDLGTYDQKGFSREQELSWICKRQSYGPNGGEIPAVSEWCSPKTADLEFEKLQLSYLNLKYNQEIYEFWNHRFLFRQNALRYLSGHLGYRCYVSHISFPKHPDQTSSLTMKIRNQGYAPMDARFIIQCVCETEDGKLHILEELVPEDGLRTCRDIEIPMENLKALQPCRLGLRLAFPERTDPPDCIQLVNRDILFENGINWLLEFPARGNPVLLLKES